MEQLVESAQALKIYEEVTRKLYQILKQLQTERLQMETRITDLQKQLKGKDQTIKELEQKIRESNSDLEVKQNFVQVFGNIQSQPLLGEKKQIASTSQTGTLKGCKIDINSYFKGLIKQMDNKQVQNQCNQSFSPSKKQAYINKTSQSCWEQEEVTDCNISNCQKVLLKNPKILTRAQTSETNSKDNEQMSSNKENIQFLNPNQTINLFLPFQLQLQNLNKNKEPQIFNQKDRQYNKSTQNTLNISNFMSHNIKPRKPSFAVSKYPLTQY